jgi:altronate dehydratase small subunit
MDKKSGLQVNTKDNVATLFANEVAAGDEVTIRDKAGNAELMCTLSAIPYGHKIAVRDITKGEPIIKYGEKIGLATVNIKRGEHVHVHNLDSARGRGDL